MNVIKEFFGMKTGQALLHDIKRIALALEKIAELLEADYKSRHNGIHADDSANSQNG